MRLAAMFLALASVLVAHDVSRSDSKVEIQGKEVRVFLTLNYKELQHPALTSPEIEPIFAAVQRHYFVSSPATPIQTTLEKYSAIGGPLIQLQILYTFEQTITTLNVKSTLHEIMPAGHQHFMSARLNGTLFEAILDSRTPEAKFTGVQATNLQTFWRFLRLGVEHVFTGYDHLAFLLGLLVATATIGSLVRRLTPLPNP